MKFTNDKPTEPGFYWCIPRFSNVSYLDCDKDVEAEQGKKTITQIVEKKRPKPSLDSDLCARLPGHKSSYALWNPVVQNFLWGERIKTPE